MDTNFCFDFSVSEPWYQTDSDGTVNPADLFVDVSCSSSDPGLTLLSDPSPDPPQDVPLVSSSLSSSAPLASVLDECYLHPLLSKPMENQSFGHLEEQFTDEFFLIYTLNDLPGVQPSSAILETQTILDLPSMPLQIPSVHDPLIPTTIFEVPTADSQHTTQALSEAIEQPVLATNPLDPTPIRSFQDPASYLFDSITAQGQSMNERAAIYTQADPNFDLDIDHIWSEPFQNTPQLPGISDPLTAPVLLSQLNCARASPFKLSIVPTTFSSRDPVLFQAQAPEIVLSELLYSYPPSTTTNAINPIDNNNFRVQNNVLGLPDDNISPLYQKLFGSSVIRSKRRTKCSDLKHHASSKQQPRISHLKRFSPHDDTLLCEENPRSRHYPQYDGRNKNNRTESRCLGARRVTDSAHYRPRNAFFMFRGFVSRIQSSVRPKKTRNSFYPLPSTSSTSSFLSYSKSSSSSELYSEKTLSSSTSSPSSTLRRVTGQAQIKVSVSCGRIWSSECFGSCSSSGCANCRMRSLFGQASDYLKLRQAEIERGIEFPPKVGDRDPSSALANMPLEDSFNWVEFQQLYYDSDLFKWHREGYLAEDGVLDVEELKRIWMDTELSYEKSFKQAAHERIALEVSGKARATGQRIRRS